MTSALRFGCGLWLLCGGLLTGTRGIAAEPAVPPIPAPGIELSPEDQNRLQSKLTALQKEIDALRASPSPVISRYLPDVEIFSEAVRKALQGKTFYSNKEVTQAEKLLEMGHQRAAELAQDKHPWTRQKGLVVRGYRSRLDDSVQPYGLVIGKDWNPDQPTRCDLWFRGRSVKGLEVQFLNTQLNNAGSYQLDDGIVLHPMGRYCNANRFAGEVDVFEALEHAQQDYMIDPDRIAVRGFSMGGASTWGLAVHYPCRWFAANPGAGFSETRLFLGFDKKPELLPPEYQQKMWALYDADVLADNLFNLPVIAYSGEIDKQKLAADIMVAAASRRGIELTHVIGPQTAHKIHPESNLQIAKMMADLAEKGRPKVRDSVRFCTYTLKYNRCDWIIINGLIEHWEEAYVDGDVIRENDRQVALKFKTRNVDDFSIDFAAGRTPFSAQQKIAVVVDGQTLSPVSTGKDGSLQARFVRVEDNWRLAATEVESEALRKRHNLQGPIDDALMDSFLFVLPSEEYAHPEVKAWVDHEQARAAREWERQMRGNVRSKRDSDVTAEDIENYNLILWGSPESNSLIGKYVPQLPIDWSQKKLTVGDQQFDPSGHALILIYPNPDNPKRYIVFNSGVTFREADYVNNARQTPKLPDWAVIDLSQPPTVFAPGKVSAADFFDERWQLKQPAK